jgi:hypothetical protein
MIVTSTQDDSQAGDGSARPSEPVSFRRNTVVVDGPRLMVIPESAAPGQPQSLFTDEMARLCSDPLVSTSDVAERARSLFVNLEFAPRKEVEAAKAEALSFTRALASTGPRAMSLLSAYAGRMPNGQLLSDEDRALPRLLPRIRNFFSKLAFEADARQIHRLVISWAAWFTEDMEDSTLEPRLALFTLHILLLSINLHDRADIHIDSRGRGEIGLEDWVQLSAPLCFETGLVERVYWSVSEKRIFAPSQGSAGNLALTEMLAKRNFSGWLTKQGGRRKNWRRRYMVLTHDVLWYFKDPKDGEATGMIPLSGLMLRDGESLSLSTTKKRKFQFILVPRVGQQIGEKTKLNAKKIMSGRKTASNHSEFCICADTYEQMIAWQSMLHMVLQRLLFYEDLSERAEYVGKLDIPVQDKDSN